MKTGSKNQKPVVVKNQNSKPNQFLNIKLKPTYAVVGGYVVSPQDARGYDFE